MTLIYLLIAWCSSIGTFAIVLINCNKCFDHMSKLHRVPCSKCQYFTDNRYLKCTVHPVLACSEEAIDCRDFIPQALITHQQRSQQENFAHTL